MKLTQSRVCRETMASALELDALGLWRELDNDECFALVVPEEEHPMFATIMGQGGMEFGLMLLRGEDAPRNLIES